LRAPCPWLFSQRTGPPTISLSMNPRVLPASCRQRNLKKALPTRRRQHLGGGTVRLVRVSRSPMHGSKVLGALSMNLPLSLPSPPLWAGERVAEGRERGDSDQFMVPMHGKNGVGAFHVLSDAPPGFGLRQSSSALALEASQPKAPEDWRSPRRYRAVRSFRSQCLQGYVEATVSSQEDVGHDHLSRGEGRAETELWFSMNRWLRFLSCGKQNIFGHVLGPHVG